jgi:hypothetical protein
MAHYAIINNSTNIVEKVIVGLDEKDQSCKDYGFNTWEEFYEAHFGSKCIRTSYNHNIRKQFAQQGFSYIEDKDVFVAPKPYPSWELDDDLFWTAPVPRPDGVRPIVNFYGNFEELTKNNEKELLPSPWVWNENNQSWELINVDYSLLPKNAKFLDKDANILYKNNDEEIVTV